jgi:hypothetical protein
VRPEAGWSQRYETLQEAREGHQLAIEWLKNTKLTRASIHGSLRFGAPPLYERI